MANHKYTVSAVISLFKGEKFIRGRIEDLLAQTLGKEVEIIIVDSNSPQNEKKIIDEYLPGNDNIKYLRTPETESMYTSWNRGIEMSSGRYITNANVDDRLAPFALEKLVAEIEKDEKTGLVYGDYFVSPVENESFDEASRNERTIHITDMYSPLRLLNGYMCGPQSLWRREVHTLHKIHFDGSFEVTGDYKFVADVSKVYEIRKINANLGVYFRSPADENKEYQNLDKTIHEAFKIKLELINHFLDNGVIDSDSGVTNLMRLFRSLPVRISALIWKISAEPVINYETIYWIIAVSAEREGDYKTAKKIISRFKNFPKAVYIQNYEKYLTAKGVI